MSNVYHYSIVQYCPNLARQERVNVGIVILNPTTNKIYSKFTNNVNRIDSFFKPMNLDCDWIIKGIQMFQSSLNNTKIESIDDLDKFIGTRINDLIMSKRMMFKTYKSSEEELEDLFSELIEFL